MNGFADHQLDESAFGEKKTFTDGLRTFDAFPKTKPTYSLPSRRGGQITTLLLAICALLTFSELHRWWQGHQTHHFSVEKGVSHDLQINLDVVVAMHCADLHINVQDASGDRILAGDMLRRDATDWERWVDAKGVHRLHSGGAAAGEAEEEQHVHDVLAQGKRGRKFAKTPRVRGGGEACRIYGSLEGNKVQGDFHITARGHGYMEFGEHLDHSGEFQVSAAPTVSSAEQRRLMCVISAKAFNFSHIISELSFGPFYPSLLNPLDRTLDITPYHFFKFQYYLSVVPTIYTRSLTSSSSLSPSANKNTIVTNQYAVTSQSYMIGERMIPGIFFKFDIEPILLTVSEEKGGLLALCVRLVNIVSGVLVGGGWCYQLSGWVGEVWGRRKRRAGQGVLHGRATVEDADED